MEFARVKFYRARFVPGEVSQEEAMNEGYDEHESVGYLIVNNDHKVVLAQGSVGMMYCDIICIPKANVVSLTSIPLLD